MRKRIVAGNWKMNTDLQNGVELARTINSKIAEKCSSENCVGVVIAPPFTHLNEISKNIDPEKICLAAQNCASEEKGAFTGEVSAAMLKSVGVRAVIIGHSERRQYYKECDATLLKKVNQVLKQNMKVIFCCGEVLSERQAENHFNIVKSQLENTIFKLTPDEFKQIIIAYEPVWAIGTGVTASPKQAQEMHNYIRNLVAQQYGFDYAQKTTVLYGGSCNAQNARELFENPDVDGGLIGGASLKADEFLTIINSF